MTNVFYDNFTNVQVANPNPSTLNYGITSNWAPDSNRTLSLGPSPPSSGANIGSSSLYFNASGATSQAYLEYTFPASIDLSNLTSITFQGSTANVSSPIIIEVVAYTPSTYAIVGKITSTLNSTPTDILVPISNPGNILNNVTKILIIMEASTSTSSTVYFGSFISFFVCVAYNSLILTPYGNKLVQDIKRGDEIVGGKVARLIRYELHPRQMVESVFIPASCIDKNVPYRDTVVCAEHYFIYKGKRRLAKCFLSYPGVVLSFQEAEKSLPIAEDGNYYFYDIQFDHEGEYIVNGIISQSRSPYASASPLPEELYFEKENYKGEKVKNTFSQEPPICTKYLLPNGLEVEEFFKFNIK